MTDALPRSVLMQVSCELLAQLEGQWSEPVQVMVEADPSEVGGYRMVLRRAARIELDRIYKLIQAATHGVPGQPIPVHHNDAHCPSCMDAAKAVLMHINEDVKPGPSESVIPPPLEWDDA